MKHDSKYPGLAAKWLALSGIGLCALCCALPFAGLIGGAAMLAGVALYAERIGVVLIIESLAVFAIVLLRKRRARACDVNCDCKTETKQLKNV